MTSTSRRLRSEKASGLDAGPARWPADGWSLGSLAASGPRLAWATADTLSFTEVDLPVARLPEDLSVPVEGRPKRAEGPAPERKATPWERHLAAVAARAEAAKQSDDRVRAATQTAPRLRAVARSADEAANRASRPGRHPAGRQAASPRPRPASEEPHVEWAKDRSLEPIGPRASFASGERPARIKVTGVRRPLPRPVERPARAAEVKPIARRIAELPRHPAVAGAPAPVRAAASRTADDAARWTVIDLRAAQPVHELPKVAAVQANAEPPTVLRLEPLNRKEGREARESREARENTHASRVRPSFPPIARRASGDGFTLSPGHSRA
ncbi:MAG TPA: hypothetical protein VFW71_10680 [Actinomycetota bacterium]|nr:hypothetical protein [Actinomycetota bacterium]